MKGAMAWRSICLILLLVASFQLATVVHAQTDYSFARWFTAAGRAVPDNVCINTQPAPRWCDALRGGDADFKEYKRDKEEAIKRGISFHEIFSERKARARIAQAKREREWAEARNRGLIFLAVAATVALVVIVIVFRARRRIAAAFSRRWQSKEFRVWAFGSVCWIVGTPIYGWLAESYGSIISDDEFLHLLSVMIVPPLFLGAVWFGYKRFVK